MGSLVLLDLMGGVALLLWGLHMVHSGILRAFGPNLRQLLAKALSNRFTAFGAGLGLTALLQSSTATALITSSFTSEGLVSLVPALAIMLGANVGTTLIVQTPVVQHLRRCSRAVPYRAGRIPQRGPLAHQGHRPRLHRPRPDVAGPAYPAQYAGAGGERTRRARVHERHHRRSRSLHHLRGPGDLAGAFERRQRAAGDVAGLCAFHHALRGAGAGARRQSRQRHQSDRRGRAPRQSRQLSPSAGQPDQPAGRYPAGGAVPAADLGTVELRGSRIWPRQPRYSTSRSMS